MDEWNDPEADSRPCRALSNNDPSKVSRLQSVIQKEMRQAKSKHARSVKNCLKSEPSQAWKSLNKQVRDPATCRELYFGWTNLCPEVGNTAVAYVIKIFLFTWARLILFPAYLAMWRSYDEACSDVRGKIAFYSGYWRNRKSMKSMNIGLAVLMMMYFLRSEPADE